MGKALNKQTNISSTKASHCTVVELKNKAFTVDCQLGISVRMSEEHRKKRSWNSFRHEAL